MLFVWILKLSGQLISFVICSLWPEANNLIWTVTRKGGSVDLIYSYYSHVFAKSVFST